MLKKLCLIGICAMAFSAQAALTTYGACAGGTGVIVKGLKADRYCLSNIRMNWFSAFSWCEAAGGHLANLNEACDYNGDPGGDNYCPNPILTGGPHEGYAWLSTSSGDGAFYLHADPGWTTALRQGKLAVLHALCAGNY